MSKITTKDQVWYFVEETTVETEEAVSSGDEAVGVLEGGAISINKENLERAVITDTLGKSKPLSGMHNFAGNVSVEAKAGDTEGEAPEYAPMLKTICAEKLLASAVTSKAGTPTTTEIPIEDADISSFAINDIVLIKESGAYHVSPIDSIVSTVGSATITLKYAADSAFTSGVTIAKFANYQPINEGHDTISIFREQSGDADTLTDKVTGARCSNMALSNFSTGQLPQLDFTFQGLNGSRVLTDSGQTPAYDSSQPPVVLSAYIRANGAAICLNDFSFTVEDTIGKVTCVTQESGMLSQRITDRLVSGTLNPYKEDDSLTLYNLAQNRTTFEIFVAAYVPSTTSGEFDQVTSYYFPNCVITENEEGDVNGVVTENFTFQAFDDGTDPEFIMSYS